MTEHVLERVEGDVAGQHLEVAALRLEGVHGAAGADEIGECDRVRADVRAGVDDRIAEPDEQPQELDLELAPLAVEVEPAPDEGVVAIVHEQAMLAALDRHVPVLDQVGRLHGLACCLPAQGSACAV